MGLDTLASLSDTLMVVAVIGYVAATALHAAEVMPATAGSRRASGEFVAVTAGGAAATSADTSAASGRLSRGGVAGVAAVGVTVAAAAVHVGSVLTRGLAAHRVPWANLYEFILVTTVAGALTWLVVVARRGRAVRPVGVFVSLGLALLLGGAGRVHVRVAPLVPALDSPWLKIHVVAAATSAGLMLVGFVTTVLYLLRRRHDEAVAADRPAGPLLARMPAAGALDRLAGRLHVAAFPLWTFAVICGAVWAEAAWGRYWAWDPKETWAFISWILYAAYLHARTTAGWRGRPAALVAVAAWTSMLVNLFAVNMLFPSLHSYAGL